MLFWLTLASAIVVVVASIAYAAVKGLEAYRTGKRLLAAAAEDLDRITRASAEIELHLQAAATSGTQLDASLTRLGTSRARLNVLTSALADVRAAVGRVTWIVPRK
jgi:hypothetical protein